MAVDVTIFERNLNTARMAFNIKRAALESALKRHDAREGAADRLIAAAMDYGIDHTLAQLASNPFLYDIRLGPADGDIAVLKASIEGAYEASHELDRAMAARENALRAINPSRPKGLLFEGRDAVADPDKGTVHYRDTKATEAVPFVKGASQDEATHGSENERER